MPGVRGKRKDGRNLVAEWQALNPGGAFVHDTRQFEDARGKSPVLGLFELSHMQYEHDRDRGPEGEPDLEAMTRFAIESLSRNPDRSEEHTSELQSLMRISYAVFCLKKKKKNVATSTHAHT